MDIQSFIQSGLLEAYVAGQCNAAEQQQVEQMAAQHAEVRAELDKIEQALENLSFANAIEPPKGLKGKVLDKINQLPEMETQVNPTQPTKTLRLFQILAVAALALAGYFYGQKMAVMNETVELRAKVSTLQQQVDDCAKRREHTEPMAALLRDTDTEPVKLTDGKTYNITVFNNKLRKECALDLSGVPVPSTGKFLQAWALVDGVPVSLGMVQLNATAGWQPLPFIEKAQAYALSEETSPQGNPTPTLVIAIGNIDAG